MKASGATRSGELRGATGPVGVCRRVLVGAMLAGLLLGGASADADSHGPPAHDGGHEASGRPAPGSFCTFATCAPRRADPARGVLAFGGTALVAGLLARRRLPRH